MSKPAVDSPDLYGGYARWKQWEGDFSASDRDARNFAAEFAGIELTGKRVLEIGFGNGSFLAWARARGAMIGGTEIEENMLARARDKGFETLPSELGSLAASGRRFDIVVAFDVFEHWDKPTLITNLKHLAAVLDAGGLLVARFPNGHSPFGRVYQHGDLTHLTALSKYSLEQLAVMTGFEVVRVDNAQRVPLRRDIWAVLKHHWRKRQRARIEVMLSRLYGLERLPLDPNLTAVMRKPG
jgi:2-polyprenyl-3-methyl-5-hydroxy-6-metoxy-1,4-benzoquinol methylase